MLAELGPEALEAMRALKQAFDPRNIFNPGKILPAL
jgi:D-lactate dehydrogenase (cytochrome)